MFEKRPTDLKKIGKAIFIGLSLGIPAVAIIPRILASNSVQANGDDRVPVVVHEINNQSVTFEHPSKGTVTVPLDTFRNNFALGSNQ